MTRIALLCALLAGCAAADEMPGDEGAEAGNEESSDGALPVTTFSLDSKSPSRAFAGACSEFFICDIHARVSPTDDSAKQAARAFFAAQPDATTFIWNWGEVWLERDGQVFEPSPAYGGRRAKLEVDRDAAAADGLTVRRNKHIVGGIWEPFDKFYWGDFRKDSKFEVKVQLTADALTTGIAGVEATILLEWN